MISMDRLVLSMQSMMIANIGKAMAGDDAAPATDITPTADIAPPPQAPSPDAPMLAELAIAPGPAQIGQGGAHDLAGLKPPVAGLMASEHAGPSAAEMSANPNTASYLATGMGARAMAPVDASPLRSAAGTGGAAGAADVDGATHPGAEVRVSPEARASAAAGRDIAVGVDRPVTGGGDRTELFDGTKPPAMSDTSLAVARPPGETVSHADTAGASERTNSIEWGADAGHAVAASTAEASRGGIIASFILNAGMIPGWPAPRPLAGAEVHPEALAGRMPPDPSITDDEALKYLANLGADPALVEKVRKMLQKPPPGKKILLFLATLLTALTVVIETLKHELEALAEERKEREESQENADPHGRSGAGRRKRIYLE
jgi:hypothetical protein